MEYRMMSPFSIGSMYGQADEAAENSIVVEGGCEELEELREGAHVGAADCQKAQAYAGGGESEGICDRGAV